MARDSVDPATPWSRAERTRIIAELLRIAMIEIRYVASQPESSRHPDGQLAHLRALADVCHRLPGAGEPQPAAEYDALVWTWQVANDFQRRWLRTQFNRMGADMAFLLQAPRLPRPATAPDTRPRWRHWQLPRDPDAFKAVDTATLVTLVHGVGAGSSGKRRTHSVHRMGTRTPASGRPPYPSGQPNG